MKKLSGYLLLTSLLLSSSASAAILNLGDDDFSQQGIGFNFNFFGTNYSDVYVGSNGYLTFGNGDTDFTESVRDMLNNEARIAVWDDFDPRNSGAITTSQTATSFTVEYSLVPQWARNDQNSFSISLFSDGAIEIFLNDLSTNDLLVGISAGGGISDPGAIDFSAVSGPYDANQTTYQKFNNHFDLNGSLLRFEHTGEEPSNVPEPTSIVLLGLGLMSLGLSKKKKTNYLSVHS